MSDLLKQICGDKRTVVKSRKADRPLAEQETRAAAAPPPRGFHRRLAERARGQSLARLVERRLSANREENDDPGFAMKRVEDYHIGAFAPWSQQPGLQAILLPSGLNASAAIGTGGPGPVSRHRHASWPAKGPCRRRPSRPRRHYARGPRLSDGATAS